VYNFNLDESSEYETLGGLVLHYLESIPEEGTILELENYSMRIEAVTDRRIEVIRLKILANN